MVVFEQTVEVTVVAERVLDAQAAAEWAAGRLGIDPELRSLGRNRKAYNPLKRAQIGKS